MPSGTPVEFEYRTTSEHDTVGWTERAHVEVRAIGTKNWADCMSQLLEEAEAISLHMGNITIDTYIMTANAMTWV